MRTSQPPASPNFRQAAVDQGGENKRAAIDQSTLNNPNFHGIGGSQTVTIGPDGRPVVNQSLDQNQQRLYDQYTRNQGAAGDAASRFLSSGQAGSVFDTSSLGALPSDYEGTRQRVIDAMMSRATGEIDREGDQLNSDLVARGLRPGTEAYERERDALARKENDYRSQAELAGDSAATNALRGDLARRASGLNELQLQRSIPMSEFATLMNGSRFQMPNLPGYQGNTTVAPAPLYGATTAQSNYDVDLWNAQQQQRNSQLNGGVGILGGILGANPNSIGGNLLNQGINYVGNNAGNWWDSLFGGGSGSGGSGWATADQGDWWDWAL